MNSEAMLPRPEFAHKDVPIMVFRYQENEYQFRNYPSHQRHYVWPHIYRQTLIDTILRGLPIPPILAYRTIDTTGERYFIVDGKQRLETIYAFLGDQIMTPKTTDPPYRPMYPNLLYSQLPPNARRLIDNYSVRFEVLVNADRYETSDLALMFRRLQIGQKLSSAEILWSQPGVVHDLAIKLESLSWWNGRISDVSQKRRAIHYFALALILLEINDGFAEVEKRSIERLKVHPPASFDSDRLLRGISSRLDKIAMPAKSLKITSIPDLVVVTQAARFLDQGDVVWGDLPDDSLTQWIYETRDHYFHAAQSTMRLRHTPWGELMRKNTQFDFWTRYRPSLLDAMRSRFKDPQRVFSSQQKMSLWAAQKGRCDVCGKPVSIDDVGHHRVLHANGGPTTIENGALIHVECHRQLHAAGK